uniref:Protein P1 n=1 Tax=Ryegrass mottle virus TaxID=119910 RepID=A0A894IZ79_9VIRU|nr:protein P1 [Ryegrass mottle virus]
MPSVVIEVCSYDEETGDCELESTAKIFTSNFDGTYVLYTHSSGPKYAGSTVTLVCPHCGVSEQATLPTRGLSGNWGHHGLHDLRLDCKARHWHGTCEVTPSSEQESRVASDGVFEPGLARITTTRGQSWTRYH